MIRGTRLVAWLAMSWAVATSNPGDGSELWRSPVGSGECRIELTHELGDLRVQRQPAHEEIVVLGDPAELAIERSSAGSTVLTVVQRPGLPPDTAPSGDVELSAPRRCEVVVRSRHGSITGTLGPRASPFVAETVTGDITMWIDPEAGVRVHLATSGEMTTDYSIEIELRYHEEPAKHGRIAVAGGTAVELTSKQGSIRILRPSSLEISPGEGHRSEPEDRDESPRSPRPLRRPP